MAKRRSGPGPEARPRPRGLLTLWGPDLRLFLIMSSRDMSSLLDILSERKSVLLGLLSFEKKRRNSGVWEGREEGRGF